MESMLSMMVSPRAVPSLGSMLSIARRTTARSLLGGTSTVGLPDTRTTETLNPSGMVSMNLVAACLAASIRVGSTSLAPM